MSATPATDLLFGGNGVCYPGVVASSSGPEPVVAVQSDGKLVVADQGASPGHGTALNVVRLNADGSPDSTFGGTEGIALDAAEATAELVRSDGKILVAVAGSPWDTQGSLYRLNSDGSLDTSFGTGGRAAVPLRVTAILEGSDGAVFVAGASGSSLSLVRLLDDGSIDGAFGSSGTLTIPAESGTFADYGATRLLPTPDGKLVVVAAQTAWDPATAPTQIGIRTLLARVNAGGTLDRSFNFGQPVLGPVSASYSVPTDALVLPDGSILVASRDSRTLSLARYNFDGSPDASFGTGGVATDSLGNNFMGGPLKAVLRDSGEIVVEGFGTDFAYNGHFTPNGQLLQSETTPAFVMPDTGATTPTDIPSGLAVWQNTTSTLDLQGNLVAFGNTPRADGSGWVYPLAGVRVELDDYAWSGDPSFHWGSYPTGQADTTTTAPISVSGARSDLRSARRALRNDLADLHARLHADVIALRAAGHGHDTQAAKTELRLKIKQDHAAIVAQRRKDRSALSAARHRLQIAIRARSSP